jgi:ankyrin repeat protein
MKTQKVKSLSAVTGMLVAISIVVAACQGQVSGKTETVVRAPDIDIHTAVITGNREALKQHIAAGSDINVRDPFGGSSPLISAAVFCKSEEAKILIDAGADINFQNNDGSSALHTAAFFCRPEIVKMLLEAGADKTIRNKYGATAYESVIAPFKDVKPAYDMMVTALSPMGLTLDYTYVEKTRPEIAGMLK